MILCQELQTVGIADLRPHPKNPRKGNVSAIAESIEFNGFYGAIVAQKSTGYILAGNHRWMAAKESGMSEVPVFFVDVDDVAAKRILLADNRTNDLAGYDDKALADVLAELSNAAGLEGTGYSSDDLDRLVESLTVPDFEPATEEDQGRLDQKKPCTCPQCGHEFTPN